MATPLRHTPAYEDRLTAWHNQRLWYLLCGAGAVIAVLIVVLCVVILRPHGTPYVIEVDKKGEPTGTLQPFMLQEPVTDKTIRYSLGEYIREAFCVTHISGENQMNLSQVYAMSTGQATGALTAYYRANHDANNPLFVANKYWQDVRIVRTLKLPAPSTYQVDYILDRHDNNGSFTGVQTNWRATMRIVQAKPTDNNPLGIWVSDLDFEPEAK
jgi:type IV secretory pathway TrbF-like protein